MNCWYSITIFNRLLRSLAEAPEDETPGKYEKRLTSMKLVKGTAGVRRGILAITGNGRHPAQSGVGASS
ncbi:hypothetical protein [Paenibacillus sp. FSL M7-1046]|uniref:hypothetical protein n=1 Tax=Paenibacillus sp. FSL M7-1046 TaxID=2975315 RepID=UPI0030F980D6